MSGITRVVLYKHGVGYFERVEEVEGDQEVRLAFRATEMNDVLKSLTIHDLDGGTVQSVSYDTQESAARRLEELGLDLPAAGGSATLLGKVRGARVEVEAGSRRLAGQVVGVEEVPRLAGQAVEKRALLTLLDAEGRLHTVDLAEVGSVSFLDEALRRDLAFYFDTLLHTYRRETKYLTLYARGQRRRRVELSYVVECPVWKTSYRVLLPSADGEAPFLQGWAMVDNTQDEDWEDVRLSLVAGLPISFRHDLYSPRFIRRREVVVDREAAAGPVRTERAVYSGGNVSGSPPRRSDYVAYSMEMDDVPFGGEAPSRRQALATMVPETVTQSLGDLFEYSLAQPVTVQRNQSALVPILAGEAEGRRIVLYNRAQREDNPFAALELRNTTGLTLEGGPAVVLEGNTYAGEAMLDTMKPDETRIVAFAVDLGVLVESKHAHRVEEVSYVRARRGRLELTRARIERRVYRFCSKDDRPRTCLLEHPVRAGYELWNTPAPKETTPSFHRFEVALAPRQTTEFRVLERTHQTEHMQIRALDAKTFELYVSRGIIPPAQKSRFDEVLSRVAAFQKLTAQRDEARTQLGAMNDSQERLRKNLKGLGNTADEARLRTRYVEKLEAEESEIERLQQQLRDLEPEIDRRYGEIEAALERLDFEEAVPPS